MNKLIQFLIQRAVLKGLIRVLVSHERVALTDGDKVFARVELKPERKGEIFGKGEKGKKPLRDFRIKITVTDYGKDLVGKERANMI